MAAATSLSGLVISAVINIALGVLFFALYSVFRKQPSNASVYFARQILRENRRTGNERGAQFFLRNFLPSASWALKAWQLSEEEILDTSGLDSLVFIRTFIFCLRFFGICTVIGIFVLLPMNYVNGVVDIDTIVSDTLDKFTISNVTDGSDRLWVHFCVLYFISFLGYLSLYMEYDYITKKRVEFLYSARPQPEQFTVLVHAIPSSPNKGYGRQVDEFFHSYYVDSYLLHQIVYKGDNFQKQLDEAQWLWRELHYLKSIPPNQRRYLRTGFLGLFGRREDPVDYFSRRCEVLCERIKVSQSQFFRSKKELPVAFVSFKTRKAAAMAAKLQQTPNPFEWATEWAPEPRDVNWKSFSIHFTRLWIVRIAVGVIFLCIVILYFIPAGLIYTLATLDNLKKWFPFVQNILSIPLVGSFINGYLPSLLLTIIYYFIPPLMLSLTKIEGYPSNSIQEIKTSGKVFIFFVINSFFLVTYGSILNLINEAFDSPKQIPALLASGVSSQANFFMNFVMTKGWTGFSLEILQPYLLVVGWFWRHVGRKRHFGPYVEPLPYFRALSNFLLFIFIGFIYAIPAPLMLPFLMIYFILGYIVFSNQVINKYEPAYETGGKYWPHVHNRVIFSLLMMQIVCIGMFGVKLKAKASSLCIPLLGITILFHYYCNIRFYPSFKEFPFQITSSKDMDDEKKGLKEDVLRELHTAYLCPYLKPVDIDLAESSSHEPLLPASQHSYA